MSKTANKLPSEYVKEGDGFADVTLSREATINGVKQKVIRMREPTVADQEAFQDSKESEATREITAFANLCEVAPADIRALPLRDYGRLQAAFALFTS
jgi:phage/plasmid primase-like uncharacterized protein